MLRKRDSSLYNIKELQLVKNNMFGSKKVEESVKPMSGYPTDQLKDIKNALLNKAPHIITDVKWEDVKKIWIDRIQLYKNSQGQMEMYIKDNPTKDYMKAWNLGLGRFIKKDWRKNQNLEKYKFVYFPKEEGYKGLVAFIRFVDFSDIDDDYTIEDLQKYKCISFEYQDNIYKDAKYVSVMKIFVKNETYSDEVMLNQEGKIRNIDDEYFDAENEYFYSSLSETISDEEEIIDDEPMPIKSVKGMKDEEEFLNQDNLF